MALFTSAITWNTERLRCLNGYAFFEFPGRKITQAQLDTLFDWTQEPGAESWEVIADFLGIEQT